MNALFAVFDGRVPHAADFVTYWHEKARARIAGGATRRAGLLATQNIRGGPNRLVLRRVKETGDIFLARSDDPWVLSGAAVHISFVGQDNGSDAERELDGRSETSINPNLTSGVDLTKARQLPANTGIAFQGVTLGGPFDLTADLAGSLLAQPNPDGRSNRDVVRPVINGQDITGRSRNAWAIDFGASMPMSEAALYEAPFEYARAHVQPFRAGSRRAAYAERWWLPMEARPGMRRALARLERYIATPITSKHRLFVWVDVHTLPLVPVTAIARDDDYTFGILQSRVHETWALAMGTQLEARAARYTPTTCFETFPFPPDPTLEQRARVGEAARHLVDLRDGWLNPRDLAPEELEARTLTNLYNNRPTWLDDAHSELDNLVTGTYGWASAISARDVLSELLRLNLRIGEYGISLEYREGI